MIDAFKTNGSSPPDTSVLERVPSMSEGVVEAYGRGRDRKWRWSARVKTNGRSVQYRRQGFDTKDAALADRDRVLGEIRNPGSTNTTPTETITLGAALDRLLVEKARRKTVAEYTRIANHLKAAFGKDTLLPAVTAAKISAYRGDRLANPSARTGRALTPASVNRPLAVLRHVLKLVHEEWGLAPEPPRVRLEKESQGRLRWLTQEEAARLLAAAAKSKNPDLHDLTVVALYTGTRRSELLGLTWDRVDRARGVIRLEVTKSGKRREVPFGTKVDAVFERRAKAGAGHVFPRARWDSYRTAFETAVAAAQLDDFKWHDLRHLTLAARSRGGRKGGVRARHVALIGLGEPLPTISLRDADSQLRVLEAIIRRRHRGNVATRCALRRSYPQGRQARRSSDRTGREVRTGHEPQDRQGARPDDPAVAAGASGSGHRVGGPPPRQLPRRARLPAPATEPELQLLHRTFDNWHGLGLMTVGVERQGMRLSLSHIADGEWRATFMENEKWAPARLRCGADAVGCGPDGGVGGGEGMSDTRLGRHLIALGLLLLAGCITHGRVGALPTLADPEQAAEIVVIREGRFIGGGANFTVVLDGAPVYGIAVDEHVVLRVAPGDHVVTITRRGPFLNDAAVAVRAEPRRRYYYRLETSAWSSDITLLPVAPSVGEQLAAKTRRVQ